MVLHFGKYLAGIFPPDGDPDAFSGEGPTEIGGWLSETSDDVGDREPVNVRHYTLYFKLVKVQLSSFVTLFSRPAPMKVRYFLLAFAASIE